MAGKILMSTAYLPPIEYFSIISGADQILIESEENYLKQTYRNRCYILSSHGPQILTVPIYLGSLHKTHIRDIRIDYSKRWQQVHLRAMIAAYNSSPYFRYYFESIEKMITENHTFLLDLNMKLINVIINILKISSPVSYTDAYEPSLYEPYDYRYAIAPKKKTIKEYKKYLQVFQDGKEFVHGLSIVDLVFNTGPESLQYL